MMTLYTEFHLVEVIDVNQLSSVRKQSKVEEGGVNPSLR